jgi:PAS domain-containing protein
MPGTVVSDETSIGNVPRDDKKQHKRAANRKSAQLSRKRKKLYIEELKDENDELRRKELILRSIPDLIVVFDSSGKLGFVSESFSRFLDMPPEKLEGTSFWDRICHDSVRLLKAAFMDALAAREPDADTAALGSGVWELQLLDKNSTYIVVTLNGVVHFTGEAPECVCCIRPSGKVSEQNVRQGRNVKSSKPPGRLVSSSDGSRSSDESSGEDQALLRVNPNQSVMGSENQESVNRDEVEPSRKERQRIDDGQVSESSGSEDGLASS